MSGERNFVGYGPQTPSLKWPNKARLAVNFVINYEEGGEATPEDGDAFAECAGAEFPLKPAAQGQRHLGSESLFEYGARVGVWRLLRLFDESSVAVTFFAVGLALQSNPMLCDYLQQSRHEVAGHGWRWVDYANFSIEEERKQIEKTIAVIEDKTSKTVSGWYMDKRSCHTRAILMEIEDIIYDSDSYADDTPYFYPNSQHLVLPYNLDCNDFRFTTTPGFSDSGAFLNYLKNSFDMLYAEGESQARMMSIGLHPRIGGRPGRAWAIQQFLSYIHTFDDVWITTRDSIARHWLKVSSNYTRDPSKCGF